MCTKSVCLPYRPTFTLFYDAIFNNAPNPQLPLLLQFKCVHVFLPMVLVLTAPDTEHLLRFHSPVRLKHANTSKCRLGSTLSGGRSSLAGWKECKTRQREEVTVKRKRNSKVRGLTSLQVEIEINKETKFEWHYWDPLNFVKKKYLTSKNLMVIDWQIAALVDAIKDSSWL